MTHCFRSAAFAVVFVGLAAPAVADDSTVEAVIDQWTQNLVVKDYDSWVGYWTADGLLLPPDHPPVTGHDAILAYAKDDFASAGDFSFSDWTIEAGGRLAVVTNDIKWGDQPYKQVIVLRHADDAWKVHIVMFNTGV
ncbi:YybH family protein [Bauldia sp.]|uniref:YybH family protein n=1 Tax=Bauldia sp. TaxID=2575872 RepID=UPI003BAAE32B